MVWVPGAATLPEAVGRVAAEGVGWRGAGVVQAGEGFGTEEAAAGSAVFVGLDEAVDEMEAASETVEAAGLEEVMIA